MIPELAWIVFAVLLGALTYATLALRSHRARTERLTREIEALEHRNRAVEDDRTRLAAKLAETGEALAGLRATHGALAEKHAETVEQRTRLERGLARSEEACARIETARADLASRLAALEAERAALRDRVFGFQGAWRQQLSTLEEEIATLLRQLGEYRKTRVPIPDEAEAVALDLSRGDGP